MFDVTFTDAVLTADIVVLLSLAEVFLEVVDEEAAVVTADSATGAGGCGGVGMKYIQAPKTTMDVTIKMIVRLC
jgi:hypothetical protein